MQLTVAIKRNDGMYEAALIVDQKFTRSATGKSITDLFVKLAGPILSQPQDDGFEMTINVGLLTSAETAQAEVKMRRARQIAETEAEAAEIERLTVARNRIKAGVSSDECV